MTMVPPDETMREVLEINAFPSMGTPAKVGGAVGDAVVGEDVVGLDVGPPVVGDIVTSVGVPVVGARVGTCVVGAAVGFAVGMDVGVAVVGMDVGVAVGAIVGDTVGDAVGFAVGTAVGFAVGELVGIPVVGGAVGIDVGLAVGVPVVGVDVGTDVGELVGVAVGVPVVGLDVGLDVGVAVGVPVVGTDVGTAVGTDVGVPVVGLDVGLAVGLNVVGTFCPGFNAFVHTPVVAIAYPCLVNGVTSLIAVPVTVTEIPVVPVLAPTGGMQIRSTLLWTSVPAVRPLGRNTVPSARFPASVESKTVATESILFTKACVPRGLAPLSAHARVKQNSVLIETPWKVYVLVFPVWRAWVESE